MYLRINFTHVLKKRKNRPTEKNIVATGLNISALMKQSSICSKMMIKTTIYTRLNNSTSHFLTRLYYHSMNTWKRLDRIDKSND